MFKKIEVERSEIVDSDPFAHRVKLTDGRTVSSHRIEIIADTIMEPSIDSIDIRPVIPVVDEYGYDTSTVVVEVKVPVDDDVRAHLPA